MISCSVLQTHTQRQDWKHYHTCGTRGNNKKCGIWINVGSRPKNSENAAADNHYNVLSCEDDNSELTPVLTKTLHYFVHPVATLSTRSTLNKHTGKVSVSANNYNPYSALLSQTVFINMSKSW